jgi:hypothetical protein
VNLTLLDSRSVDMSEIYFDPNTYHFSDTATGEDLTNLIRRADKQDNWPAFDPYTDNQRIFNETRKGGSGPLGDLQTNSGVIFAEQLLTDPLAAPLDALTKGVKEILANPGFKTLLVVGVLLFGAYVVLKES